MGVSIYYNATRSTPLTDVEGQAIEKIIVKYLESFSFKGEGEDFYVYELDPDEMEKIFAGATKLPNSENAILAAFHWVDCLTEIRRALSDCEWYFALDDYEIPWSEKEGYYLP